MTINHCTAYYGHAGHWRWSLVRRPLSIGNLLTQCDDGSDGKMTAKVTGRFRLKH